MKAFSANLLAQVWTPSARTGTRLVELLLFAALLPLGGLLMFPHDPIGLQAGFPWVVAGPLLFAARYGSLWGVACAVLTGLFINLPLDSYASAHEITAENGTANATAQHVRLVLGTIVTSLIVGDAASAWRKRAQQSEAENQYLRHRLKEFSADYHVLKVSHGLLEEHMAGQRLSLREALQRLKPVLSSSSEGIQAGSELMAVFSQFCSIQVAGLYAMSSDKRVDATPVATHGDMFELPLFDPILRTAIQERELVSIKLESLDEKHHENSLLAVVPLVDTDGHLHGVLAIKDMHFMAFQQQNLNILALLGNYVGNMLTRSKGTAKSRREWFLAELDTALRFARSHSTESVLMSFRFNAEEQSWGIASFISESIRSLDAFWLTRNEQDETVLCLLLPLIGAKEAQAFVQRIGVTVVDQFGKSLDSAVQDNVSMTVSRADSRDSCLAFLSAHNVNITVESDDVAHFPNDPLSGHSDVA